MRGNGDVLRAEKATPELLQSDHPSREETRFFFVFFTALIQVCGVPDGYSGPRQSGRKQGRGGGGAGSRKLSSPSNVGFYGAGRVGGGGRKPAEEFKRIVCKLS